MKIKQVCSELRNYSGFTIIEMIVVVSVIAIIAAASVVGYINVTKNAYDISIKSDLANAADVFKIYKTNNGSYPTSLTGVSDLKLNQSITWSYTVSPNQKDYCLQGVYSDVIESINSDSAKSAKKQCGALSGLVGWWKMDGNSTDSSGSGNPGLVYGAVLANGQNGESNGAYSFDGNDDYIRTTNVFSYALNNGVISFWCYTNGRGLYSGNNQEGKINISYAPLIYGVGGAGIYWPGASSEYMTGFSFSDLSWTHIVVMWNNAGSGTNNGSLYIYENGSLKKSYTGLTLPVNSTSGYVYFGHYDSSASSPYNGLIDDVRIYNRLLATSEIAALYSAGAW